MLKKGDCARVVKTTADIHEHTNDLITVKKRDSQMLFGERFEIELVDGGWAFGKSVNDGYEGFIELAALQPFQKEPTHYVSNILSHIYSVSDYRTRPLMAVSFKSELVCSTHRENGFVEVPGFGWIPEGHIIAVEAQKPSIRDVALNFLSTPYLFGGRSSAGIDCSGLAQVVLQYCGIPCPRDSDQQLTKGSGQRPDAYLAGDLVFFKGHVGIMVDTQHIIHATARTMDTRMDRLSDLEERYEGILGYWRV